MSIFRGKSASWLTHFLKCRGHGSMAKGIEAEKNKSTIIGGLFIGGAWIAREVAPKIIQSIKDKKEDEEDHLLD